MYMILLILISLTSGCSQTSNVVNNELMKRFEVNGHWANHCGVDIPICKYTVIVMIPLLIVWFWGRYCGIKTMMNQIEKEMEEMVEMEENKK